MTANSALPLPEHVLRHSGCVLLLHEILEHSEEQTIASVDVSRQSWLKRRDGTVDPWVAIEYMAQCFAAHEGLIAISRNLDLPRGFLIGVNQLRLYSPKIGANTSLHVRTKSSRGRPGLGALSHACAVFRVEANSGSTLLAEGRLTVSTTGG